MLIFTTILALYLIFLLAISWLSLHPFRIPIYLTPSLLELSEESVSFVSLDGTTLRGWWIPNGESMKTVILCHGYMMNRCELLPNAVALNREGFNVLAFDFRSHGSSQGSRCGLGFDERLDVAAACEFVRSRVPDSKVALLGSSMGAAASALAVGAALQPVDALVLDSAYSKLPGAISGWWRFVGGPILAGTLYPLIYVSWPFLGFNPFRVDVAEALGNSTVPTLFFHGRSDNLALPSEAERNFDASASASKTITWFEGCGHSEGRWLNALEYNHVLIEFLHKHMVPKE